MPRALTRSPRSCAKDVATAVASAEPSLTFPASALRSNASRREPVGDAAQWVEVDAVIRKRAEHDLGRPGQACLLGLLSAVVSRRNSGSDSLRQLPQPEIEHWDEVRSAPRRLTIKFARLDVTIYEAVQDAHVERRTDLQQQMDRALRRHR